MVLENYSQFIVRFLAIKLKLHNCYDFFLYKRQNDYLAQNNCFIRKHLKKSEHIHCSFGVC